MTNDIIAVMHRLLLEEIDGNNAERFVAVTSPKEDLPLDINGQIQWMVAFWAMEVVKVSALDTMLWVDALHNTNNLASFEQVAREQLIPVISELNLPRIEKNV